MQVKAEAKWVRISPLKLRNVMALIRGKKVARALDLLKLLPQKGARILEKVVKSAAANAKNNYKMTEANLQVARVYANVAPAYRRFKARSKGRASPIKKRNSHIAVWVKDINEKGV